MPESSEDYQNLGKIWEDNRLIVPSYQRRYAWNPEQIQDLINDLDYVRKEEDRREDNEENITHYFGTIVLDHSGTADLPPMSGATWKNMKIVDGQQRVLSITLLIELLVEVIDALADELDDDDEEMVNQVQQSLETSYLEEYDTRRVEIKNDDDWEVFRQLVYDRQSPEECRRLFDYSLPSQNRLLDAKKKFRSWLIEDILAGEIMEDSEDLLDDYEALQSGESDVIEDNYLEVAGPLQVLNKLDEEEIEVFVERVISLRQFVSDRLLVTQYEVEASSEAGRIFQSINDRGRDLIMADRIKSYLIYMADRLDQPGLAEDVFNAFSDVADTITEYHTEDEIDEFIRAHWRMWTGETRYRRSGKYDETPNDVHRRIKQLEKHASLSRDESSREDWIEDYVEDLRQSAEAYKKMMNPEEHEGDTYGEEHGTEIKRKLEGIHRCSSVQNTRCILMACYRLYARSPPILNSEDLLQIVSALENMAFRVYGAADKKSNVRRDKYRDLAHRLRWTEKQSELESIFDTGSGYDGTKDNSTDKVFSNGPEALNKTCRAIENAIGNYGYDVLMIKGLLNQDIMEGSRNTDNWNGMKKDAIRHFLWEYEFSLREEEDVGDMPSLNEIKKRKRDIEHIWARNRDEHLPDEMASEHAKHVESLGNLGLLHYSSNRSAKDASYADKYDSIYENSRMDHLSELPEPEEDEEYTWRGEQIEDRRKDLIRFAKKQWATDSYAVIHVADPDSMDREIKEELINSIRNDFSGYEEEINSGNIPRIVIDNDVETDDLSKQNSCDCGGTQIRITTPDDSDSDWEVECTDCDDTLGTPSYFFYPEVYAEEPEDSEDSEDSGED